MQVLGHKGKPHRTVLDMSSGEFPNLHNLEMIIDKKFGDDKAAFRGNNPLSIFSSGGDSTGYSVFCSTGDKESRGVIEGFWKVCQARHSQGMDVQKRTYSGTHEWKVWEKSLDDEFPWLVTKMNLIRAPSH